MFNPYYIPLGLTDIYLHVYGKGGQENCAVVRNIALKQRTLGV